MKVFSKKSLIIFTSLLFLALIASYFYIKYDQRAKCVQLKENYYKTYTPEKAQEMEAQGIVVEPPEFMEPCRSLME